MLPEYSEARLTRDFPDKALKKGEVGVIVMIHNDGEGYEIEFFEDDPRYTKAVVTVMAQDVEGISQTENRHAAE